MSNHTAVSDLNRLRFSGSDFPTIFDDLRSRLQTQFAGDFNDFNLSSLGIMLLDLTAYGLDSLAFYLDRRASDSYLDTARSRRAVSRLTRQLGYKMRPAVSSSVDLTISISSPVAFEVTIPVGFRFRGPKNLSFSVATAVAFPANSAAAKTVPCHEGEVFSESFVSSGAANQVFELRRVPGGQFVASGTVRVLVDGTPYTEQDFLQAREGAFDFECGYNDDPPTIRFGDGVVGAIPPEGATISVEYLSTSGLAGLVPKDTITDVVSPLVVAFQTILLAVNNDEPSQGGDDSETLDHARAFAGKVFKARQVAVTREDYLSLAGSFASPVFGQVAVAQAFSARSSAQDLELNGILTDLADAVLTAKTPIDAQVAALRATRDDLTAALGDVQDALGETGTRMSEVDTNIDNALTAAATAANLANSASGKVTNGSATVAAIPGGAGADALTNATKSALAAIFTSLGADVSSISAQNSAIQSALNTASSKVAEVGTPAFAPGTTLDDLDDALTVAEAQIPELSAEATAIEAAAASLSTTGTVGGSVGDLVDDAKDHVGTLLSADCKANLVVVPILGRDADGFYAAPSVALQQALQQFLDDRKEVTQTVSVTSGAAYLLKVVLALHVGVRRGFSESQTSASVALAADGLLKNRAFGRALYVSDVVDSVLTVTGVGFVNVTISGYLDPADGVTLKTDKNSDGDLLIEDREVLSKGTVTITTETTDVSPPTGG